MIFTDAEMMRAYKHALGADDVSGVMAAYLISRMPSGVEVDSYMAFEIRVAASSFINK